MNTTIKDIRNLFRLEKENGEIKDRILRDVRNVFRLEKDNKSIKDIILRNNRNTFESEKEQNFDKPIRIGNFLSNNYIGFKSNGDNEKTLSVEEYHHKIRWYLKIIINDMKRSDTWKI